MSRKTDYKTLYKSLMRGYARARLLGDRGVYDGAWTAAVRAREMFHKLEQEELREKAGG